ncbi:oligosaccharide flippase family protein [Pseudalkalibacillus sp. JSM 102089]|uniref:oligosaccharide flippase family protein n=1 Tax=Pseudalkalibacillus sp. JSM 102089 TaxID=3229856 RepID=UPI0035246BB1
MSELNKLGKTSVLVFLGKVFESLILVIFYILAIRILGADVYGRFIYIFTFLQILSMITKFGLDLGLIAFVPKHLDDKKLKVVKDLIGFTFYLTSIFSLIFITILILNRNSISTLLLNDPTLSSSLVIITPLLLLINFMNISNGIFRSINQYKHYVVSRNILIPLLMIILLFIISFFIKEKNIITLSISYYVAWGIGSFLLLYYLIKENMLGSLDKKMNKDFKLLVNFSLPLLFSGLLGFLLMRLDSLMIGYFLDDEKVAIYSISFQIALMSSFVLAAFNTMFAPTISLFFNQGKLDELSKMYKSITRWVTFINLMFFSLIILLSKEIMSIFGSNFKEGSMALILIAAGQVVNAAVGSVGHMNTMTGHPKYELYTNILTLGVNIALNIALIPNYGINGAAFASLIAIGSNNIIRLFLMYKNLKIHPFNKDYLKVVLISLFSLFTTALIKYLFDFNYILTIFIVTILFIILLAITSMIIGIAKEDKMMLHSIIKKMNLIR